MKVYRVGLQQEYDDVKDFLYFTSKVKANKYKKQYEGYNSSVFVQMDILEFKLTRKDICKMLNEKC